MTSRTLRKRILECLGDSDDEVVLRTRAERAEAANADLALRLEQMREEALSWLESARQARGYVFADHDKVDYDAARQRIRKLTPPGELAREVRWLLKGYEEGPVHAKREWIARRDALLAKMEGNP
jgi:hypothetical protein